ncbi:MAG: PA14 domain-containing protein, partial [Planctomycetota bacterium]
MARAVNKSAWNAPPPALRPSALVSMLFFLLLLLALLAPRDAYAGRAPIDPRARAAMVARLKDRASAAKARATAYAKAHGVPLRVDTGRGVRELMDVRDGRPLYYITHNENAGISTAADQVRTVYGADGAGLTVGVWDGGWVRHSHQEFGTRVARPDVPLVGDGLYGEYFENMTLTGWPAVTYVDPTINFFWNNPNKPWVGGPRDSFSVNWSGHVLAQHTETYTFYMNTEADDGVRMWVDGVLLFDDWDTPLAGEHNGTIDLVAGERYSITIDYYEDSGDAIAELRWSSPSTTKEIIPQAYLFSSSVTGWHGTHVAGTIAAGGVDPLAKGMAPAAAIDSREWNNDFDEMADAGASAPADGGIYLSNHSYGYLAGWNYEWDRGLEEWLWSWYGPWPAQPQNAQDPWFGQYESFTEQVDGIASSLPYYLICCSAGNERTENPTPGDRITYYDNGSWWYSIYNPASHPAGDGDYKSGYDTLAPWSGAKNILSVGAVEDAVTGGVRDPASGAMTTFSSWGPTDDGRIKPDVVANGHGVYSTDDVADDAYYTASGTSMSSPNATGSALLLQELYTEKFANQAMRSSTLKALIIHTADDLGRPGPDYCYGFGLINAKAAADIIDSCAGAGYAPIVESSLDSSVNTSRSYTFWWDGVTPLRATLCWTDPAGPVTSVDDDPEPRLVNDLDLRVTTFDGEQFPYCLDPSVPDADATRGDNSVDNVEQVYIDSPGTPGLCTVTVDFAALPGGPQEFGLIIPHVEQPISITDVSGPISVGTYEKVELAVTLADEDAIYPYDPDPAYGGLDLWAEFTGPSGVWPVPVNGFWDGSEWRIRFAPDETGTWNYTVTATDSGGTAVWTGGSLECVASSHPGWVRIDDAPATDWRRLRHANGEVFFGVGHNAGWQPDVEMPTSADMAAQGENLFSFWMATPWARVYDPPLLLEGPAWIHPERAPIQCAELGIDDYNQAACDYLDGVIARAEAAGVYVLPTIWSHGELRDEFHPWGGSDTWYTPEHGFNWWWYNNAYKDVCASPQEFFLTRVGGVDTPQWRYQKNFLRYLIARWGYSRAVAGWVAVCEINGTSGFESALTDTENWCREVRDWFRANDAYRTNATGEHPVVVTQANGHTWDGDLDLVANDTYTTRFNDVDTPLAIADETITMRGLSGVPRPAFHAEFGGDVRGGRAWGGQPYEPPATQPRHLHNGIWAGLASGACMTPLVWTDGGGWPLLASDGAPSGLRAEYFDNDGCDYPLALVRFDSALDFDWGTGSPDPAVPADAFSALWTGHLLAEHTGTYTFYVAADDDSGVRLWVSGQKLVDDWASAVVGEHSGTIDLTAGGRYYLVMNYREGSGDAEVHLSWSGPSTPKAIVPAAALFQTTVCEGMRDHFKYLSQFVGDLACLDDPTLTDATVGVTGGDSTCEAWGMRTAERGFAWIHDTDTGASPTLDGEIVTISGLAAGDYGVFWYDVWTSGAAYVPEPAPITVVGGGDLTVAIPALARPDIAMRFLPSPETPTPVVMSSVRARSVGAGALVEWTTASEIDNAGFDILRRPAAGGDFERVTPRPVAGRI